MAERPRPEGRGDQHPAGKRARTDPAAEEDHAKLELTKLTELGANEYKSELALAIKNVSVVPPLPPPIRTTPPTPPRPTAATIC